MLNKMMDCHPGLDPTLWMQAQSCNYFKHRRLPACKPSPSNCKPVPLLNSSSLTNSSPKCKLTMMLNAKRSKVTSTHCLQLCSPRARKFKAQSKL